jgi:hypothetical protein
MIFRKKIALFKEIEKLNQSKSTVNVLTLTGEHEIYLKNLRDQYEEELVRLKNQYTDIV